jgi:hypothetical protein
MFSSERIKTNKTRYPSFTKVTNLKFGMELKDAGSPPVKLLCSIFLSRK